MENDHWWSNDAYRVTTDLEDYMPPSDLDSFANILVVVKIAHDRLFRDMMDFIRYFQFEGRSFLF